MREKQILGPWDPPPLTHLSVKEDLNKKIREVESAHAKSKHGQN